MNFTDDFNNTIFFVLSKKKIFDNSNNTNLKNVIYNTKIIKMFYKTQILTYSK